MANRDVTNPGDTDVISAYPANERAQRVAQGVIFNQDHFDADDADQGKHRQVRLKDLGGDAADSAGQGTFYTKTVNAIVELFYIDDQANITQITRGGVISNEVLNLPEQVGDPATPVASGNLYTKVLGGFAELFWQDEQGNVVQLTFDGEINIDLGISNLIVASMSAGYYLGDVIELTSVGNAVALDWRAGQYFTLTNTETVTVSFSNEPLIGEGVGQTIMFAIQDAGNFAITLDPSTGFTVHTRAIDKPLAFTTDGLDIFILTVYASGIITLVPLYDFGP